MKFYNREKELALLEKTRQIAFTQHSQLTVLTGRRRIGKTKLILKSCEESPTVYLFVSRSNELCFAVASLSTSIQSYRISSFLNPSIPLQMSSRC